MDEAKLQLQLDCLPLRNPKDPAATFVKAVRENWAPPSKFTKTTSAETSEKERQAHQATENRQKAQQEAAKRQEIAANEEDATRLDDFFEEMDDETRDRLGVLFQEGKNSAAFAAMRRQVQREWTNELDTK